MTGGSILVVDDSLDDAFLVRRALRANGVWSEVVVAQSGQEALDYLHGSGIYVRQPPPLPQLVLLDLRMPGMDGFEILRRIRANERTRDVPVIMLTGSVGEEDPAKSYAAGANSYVRKAADVTQFIKTAAKTADYWIDLNVPVSQPAAESMPAAGAAVQVVRGPGEHAPILLVEDNPDDETVIRRTLRKSGVAGPVTTARDGQEALDYLFGASAVRNDGPLPVLIFLDLNLPRVDGLEVLRRLRADPRTRLTPVVIFTGSREEQDLLSSYQLGANSFVRKCSTHEEYVRTVQQIAEYWLDLNMPP